ncbi:MAG: hypothetical protein GX633_04275 [Clostridiales bacterium]|nr:hypothetical protein [Clostridiales bacterium]
MKRLTAGLTTGLAALIFLLLLLSGCTIRSGSPQVVENGETVNESPSPEEQKTYSPETSHTVIKTEKETKKENTSEPEKAEEAVKPEKEEQTEQKTKEKSEDIQPGEETMNEIEKIVASMSVEQKIGQLMAIPLHSELLGVEDKNHISERYYGNTFLFAASCGDLDKLIALNKECKALIEEKTGLSPMVFIDQEGGRVKRIKHGIVSLPAAAEMGKMTEDEVYKLAYTLGLELMAFGITVDAAPVLDVFTNPENTVIGDRAFGTDVGTVTSKGLAFMKGLTDAGITACVKHFPGHGDTSQDSHTELATLSHDMKRLEEVEIAPFRAAVEAGCEMMMTAHIYSSVMCKDGYPASMSADVYRYIRETLGFDGVIVTDALDMKAVSETYGSAEAALKAIQNGADLLCACDSYEKQNQIYDRLLEAVKTGELSMERVDEAVGRIVKLKMK